MNITPENARVDKLEIHFEGQSLQSRSIAELDEYIWFITNDDKSLFHKSYKTRGLESRNKETFILSIPPFSLRPTGEQRQVYPFTLKLTINCTRFLQNNMNNPPENALYPELRRFFQPNNVLQHTRRHCLDGKDNILTATNWSATQDIIGLSSGMLNLTKRLLELSLIVPRGYSHQYIHRIARNRIVPQEFLEKVSAAPYLRWEDWSLKYSEFYWDFQCEDAVSLVRELEPQLREIAVEENETEHTLKQRKRNKNALSIELPLPNNVFLVVYAKTSRRIRFEVRFKGSPRNYYNRQLKRYVGNGRAITFEDTMSFLRREATATLERIVGKLRQPSSVKAPVAITLATLMNSIYAATHDPEYPERGVNVAQAGELLSLLMANKRIVATPQNSNMLAILAKRGVLEKATHEKRIKQKRYRVASMYLPLFQQLMK